VNSNPVRAVIGLLIIGAFVYFSFFAGGYGAKVTNGPIEVYYKNGATRDEADRVAATLARLWVEGGERRSVQIVKNGETPVFRMVIKPEFHNDLKMLAQIGLVAARLSRDAFQGAAIEVEACDEYLKTVRSVPVPPNFRHGVLRGKFEVFYPQGVEKADAEQLLSFLEKAFANTPSPLVAVTLHRRGDTRVVTLPLKPEFLDKPELRAELIGYCQLLSKEYFSDQPVEFAASDESFQELRVFKP
jgi:hypothetical protein